MVPPWASTIEETIESPRPVPWIARSWAVVERKNLVNRSRCSAWGMPIPSSLTTSRA